jgi:hypothetical protein
MSRIKHLQLVLPQLLTQLRSTQSLQTWPVLQQWLQQGARQRLWAADDLQHARLDPWQQALLHTLPVTLREHGLASASLQWRGEGGAWPKGSCLHAEWVHLAAGLDDLRLVLPPAPSVDEQAQLLASVQPLLALAGFDLQPSPAGHPQHWYLTSTQPLKVISYSPRAGFATRVYDTLPQGADGAALRRVMTEVQMLLHEHPVNQQRARRGVPALNAVWLWGAAPLQLVTQQTMQRVVSNEPYVQGLAEHLHLDCWPLPAEGRALLSVDAEQVLLVLPNDVHASLDVQWFEPIHQALLRGEIETLDLYLDHWRVTLRGGRWQQLRRKCSTLPMQLDEFLS